MEIFIDCFVEDARAGTRVMTNEAIYTFVAVDQNNRPAAVPEVVPETEEERKRYEGALLRRQLALLLAGKMNAEEATAVRRLFAPK